MKVYEFWLKEEFENQAFETLCDSFYSIGAHFKRKVYDEVGSAVYAVSRNPVTSWVQLLVDDNTPLPIITAIEARINGLKDDEPIRKYFDENDNIAPVERSKE